MGEEGRKAAYRVEGADAEDLPIGPEDASVFAQINGRRAGREIAAATGLAPDAVAESLEMLEWLGAIYYADPRAPSLVPQPPPVSRRPRRSVAPADESVDIPEDRQRRITLLHAKLDVLNHYDLFEVTPTATKKEIKSAYFALMPVFHPDKYFGKELGSFKHKLEKIFQRMTEAHDVLTRKKSRAEYDDYLGLTKETTQFESLPPPPDSILRAYLDDAADSIPAPRISEKPAAMPEPTPPSGEVGKTAIAKIKLDPRSRRRALVRKLRAASSNPAEPVERSRPPATDEEKRAARDRVADELRRLYTTKVAGGGDIGAKVEQYVRDAEAMLDDDPVSAANALQLAASLVPDDEQIKARHDYADQKAAEALAATYLKRARYEEERGDWSNAARSYHRAALGMPNDAGVLERAAFTALKAGADLRTAVDYAKRSVLAAPDRSKCRATAARAYHAAGMMKSALGELKRALELDPSDSALREWLARLEKEVA